MQNTISIPPFIYHPPHTVTNISYGFVNLTIAVLDGTRNDISASCFSDLTVILHDSNSKSHTFRLSVHSTSHVVTKVAVSCFEVRDHGFFARRYIAPIPRRARPTLTLPRRSPTDPTALTALLASASCEAIAALSQPGSARSHPQLGTTLFGPPRQYFDMDSPV